MQLTYEEVEKFRQDGFVTMKDVFSMDQVQRMLDALTGDGSGRVEQSIREREDVKGNKLKLAYWENLIDDVWSAASTTPEIVNTAKVLLGEEVSFFHGKVIFKEAHSGGAWEWHQDYGYWYNQGFLFPKMLSAFVALDPSTTENGCLRVLKGSHKLGRMDHRPVGGQTGADLGRIAHVESMFELVPCEMTPGSVLFFDSNLLHCSSANQSSFPRRSFIMCYSAWSNPQLVNGEVVRREPCPTGGAV